jgi:hypothetical protein
MTPKDYKEQKLELGGWEATLTTYQLGEVFHAKVESVSVGAAISRATGATLEEAVNTAVAKASGRLEQTRRHNV